MKRRRLRLQAQPHASQRLLAMSTSGHFSGLEEDAPSILPCSQSTMIQSGFALASALDTLEPGNICYWPCQYSVGIFVFGRRGQGVGQREMILVMTSQCKGNQYPDPVTRSFIFDKGCPQPVGLLHHRGGCHGGCISEL